MEVGGQFTPRPLYPGNEQEAGWDSRAGLNVLEKSFPLPGFALQTIHTKLQGKVNKYINTSQSCFKSTVCPNATGMRLQLV